MTTEIRPPENPTVVARAVTAGEEPGRRSLWWSTLEWALVIIAAIGIATLVKVFVMQAFYIPSASMQPTLEVSDRVLVNKLSYRLHDVNRGDVVVFEQEPEVATPDATTDLIKRVVALPGERIAFDDGNVYINGQRLDEPYLPAGTTTSQGAITCTVSAPCEVPTDAVWVMGDNRSNSKDSRYLGAIPEDQIVGRAFTRVWPINRWAGL